MSSVLIIAVAAFRHGPVCCRPRFTFPSLVITVEQTTQSPRPVKTQRQRTLTAISHALGLCFYGRDCGMSRCLPEKSIHASSPLFLNLQLVCMKFTCLGRTVQACRRPACFRFSAAIQQYWFSPQYKPKPY